jgi:hypothetical protein
MATSPISVLETVSNAIKSLVELAADKLAEALGMFWTVKTSIQQVSSDYAQAATQQDLNTINSQFPHQVMPPAVLADMVIRSLVAQGPTGGINMGTQYSGAPEPINSGWIAATEASYSGVDNARFALMCLANGESYGVIDAIRLWKQGTYLQNVKAVANPGAGQPLYELVPYGRGSQAYMPNPYGIDNQQLKTVIAYSRVRNQFIPDLETLGYSTISPADVVNMVVKSMLSREDGLELFKAAGGVPEQFAMLVDGSGDAMGPEMAINLWKHNVLTEADVDQVLAMGRTNPRFYEMLKKSHAKWLTPFEFKAMLADGNVPVDTVKTWMKADGYQDDQIALWITAVAAGTLTAHKAESEAAILSEWEASMISQDQATEALKKLGYQDFAIPFILNVYEAKRRIADRNKVVARVQKSYIEGWIDQPTAVQHLNALNIPAGAQTIMLEDWAVLKATPYQHLSVAEVGWFVEHGIISGPDSVTRYQRLGYSAIDAALLLQRYPPPAAPSPLHFTSTNLLGAQVGVPVSLIITAEGAANPHFTITGRLPMGLEFSDLGGGSAIIQGTPATGSNGTYSAQVTATSGNDTPAVQTITINVSK